MSRINTRLIQCTQKDATFGSPATPTNCSSSFKAGVGQLFRIRNAVTITGSIASASSVVKIHPFWTTPSSAFVLLWAHLTVASGLTTTGAITTMQFSMWIDDPTSSLEFIRSPSPSGSVSAGTYGVGGTNRTRMAMATDPGLLLFASGGEGNTDYLSTTGGSGLGLGPQNEIASPLLAYGSTFFSKDIYLTITGDVSSWSLTGGQFDFTAVGFLTT